MDLREIKNILLEHEEKIDHLDRNLRELELLKQISTDNLLATLELRKNLETLSRRFEDFQGEMRAFKDEMKAFKDEMKIFKDEMKVFKDEMKVFKDEMKAFKDEMKIFKDEMKVFKDEMKIFKDEMNKKWGELANKLGTIVEDIFAPGMPYLAQNLGYEIRKSMLDVTYKKEGRVRQYDAIIVAEDKSGNEVVFVAEVKNQARAEDFDHLKKALEDLFVFEPNMRGKKLIPVLAAFKIPEDLINLANKRGVLLVRMGGEYLEALNPNILKA